MPGWRGCDDYEDESNDECSSTLHLDDQGQLEGAQAIKEREGGGREKERGIHVSTQCQFLNLVYHNRLLTVVLDDSDLLREHAQFLKVDESINLCLIAIVEEGQVLLEDGEEWDERGCGAPLQLSVLGHIVERVHEASQVLHHLTVLGGDLLPRGALTLH